MFSVLTLLPKGSYNAAGFVSYRFLTGVTNCHYMTPLNPAILTGCSGELGVLLVTASYCNDFSYHKPQKLVKMTFLCLRGAHFVTYISKRISSPTFRSSRQSGDQL